MTNTMNLLAITTALLAPSAVHGFAPLHGRPTTFVAMNTMASTPSAAAASAGPLHVSFADDMMSSSSPSASAPPSSIADNDQVQQPRDNIELSPLQEECIPSTSAIPEGMILSWESAVEEQVRCEVMNRAQLKATTSNQPFMIGVVGIPGSGKSTSCSILTAMLSNLGCLLMPFDGYHHPVSTLLSMDNSDDLIYRRGAPDTFDVDALRRDLETIRFGEETNVHVPGFDHAKGDPTPNEHLFDRNEHRIVITEGLYLLHDDAGWESIKDNFDMTIFVHADVDMCVERLKIRNKCIPGYTPEEIELRCEVVDRTNAMTVETSKQHANLVVQSAATRS